MPELPEVETVMRALRTRLEGRVIVRAQVNRGGPAVADPAWPGTPAHRRPRREFRRRAKYILMRLAGGDSLLLHLGMSGRVVLAPIGSNAPPPPHEHLALQTDDGWRLGFVDPRRFGSLDLVPRRDEDTHRC